MSSLAANSGSSVSDLIQASTLAELLSSSSPPKVLDCSWRLKMPEGVPPLLESYKQCRIPGAGYFDMERVTDPRNAECHAPPTSQIFGKVMDHYGICEDDHVVLYSVKEGIGLHRVWYLFRHFGHSGRISILDGGLDAYKLLPGPLETSDPNPPPPPLDDIIASSASSPDEPTSYKTSSSSSHAFGLLSTSAVSEIASKNDEEAVVLDARAKERFDGTVDEGRAGVRAGHIPGSKNLPFMELTTSSFQSHAHASSVEPLFSSLGVSLSSPDQKIVLSCGSGVTACYLAFALNAQLGVDPSRISVYDGSWSEWGKESNGMPIEK